MQADFRDDAACCSGCPSQSTQIMDIVGKKPWPPWNPRGKTVISPPPLTAYTSPPPPASNPAPVQFDQRSSRNPLPVYTPAPHAYAATSSASILYQCPFSVSIPQKSSPKTDP